MVVCDRLRGIEMVQKQMGQHFAATCPVNMCFLLSHLSSRLFPNKLERVILNNVFIVHHQNTFNDIIEYLMNKFINTV